MAKWRRSVLECGTDCATVDNTEVRKEGQAPIHAERVRPLAQQTHSTAVLDFFATALRLWFCCPPVQCLLAFHEALSMHTELGKAAAAVILHRCTLNI